MIIEQVLPFVCTIIKFRLSITNRNHEAMHTKKQYFSTREHTVILSLLTHLDFDSASSHLIWVAILFIVLPQL